LYETLHEWSWLITFPTCIARMVLVGCIMKSLCETMRFKIVFFLKTSYVMRPQRPKLSYFICNIIYGSFIKIVYFINLGLNWPNPLDHDGIKDGMSFSLRADCLQLYFKLSIKQWILLRQLAGTAKYHYLCML